MRRAQLLFFVPPALFLLHVLNFLFSSLLILVEANGNGVYYGAYRTYPTGDTLIELPYMDGGPIAADLKWIAECNDFEALVGIRDSDADFSKLETMWCKQVFHNKPTRINNNSYPYYERCMHRNASLQEFYCFDGTSYSFNSFMTALYEDDDKFSVNVDVPSKHTSGTAFKCCGLPEGYQLNYQDCQFRYTHDEYWEYFDNKYFLVKCPEKHVMTGAGWIKNPYDEDKHWDWIQCCPYNYFGSSENGAANANTAATVQPPASTQQRTNAGGGSAQVLTAPQRQLQQHQQLASAASQLRYQAGGGARRPALGDPAAQNLVNTGSNRNSGSAAEQQTSADALRALLLQPLPSPTTTSTSTTASPLLQPASTSKQRRSYSINSLNLGSLPSSFMTALTADVP